MQKVWKTYAGTKQPHENPWTSGLNLRDCLVQLYLTDPCCLVAVMVFLDWIRWRQRKGLGSRKGQGSYPKLCSLLPIWPQRYYLTSWHLLREEIGTWEKCRFWSLTDWGSYTRSVIRAKSLSPRPSFLFDKTEALIICNSWVIMRIHTSGGAVVSRMIKMITADMEPYYSPS